MTMMPPLSRFKRFDVRELISQGRRTVSGNTQTRGRLKPDEGIIIIAPFLPSPLIEKLGSEDSRRRSSVARARIG